MPQVAPILGQIAINAAIGIGASMLANAIRPQRTNTAVQQKVTTSRGLRLEVTLGESVAVSAIWGRGRTGGQLTFAQEYGDNNRYVKLKIDCGYGTYDALEAVFADEKQMVLSGSNGSVDGYVMENYRDAAGVPRAWVKWYSGAPGQTADAGLIAAAPTRWGSAHTATARPYVVITLDYQPDMFPNSSLPNFGFAWRGLRLYDWRKDDTMPGGAGAHRWDDQSTWEWTENAAVLAWNWRRGYWRNGVKIMGMGFSRYANDLSYFTATANLADEDLYFAATGATLKRYTFGREIGDDEEHLSVLRQFEEAWCGSSFDRAGAYAPIPAAAVMPVLTLEDRHRIDGRPVQADRWGKVSAKKTKIHGDYGAASELYAATPYASRINLDLQALTRGPKAVKFDQLYEHRAERAQMRAEIALRRNLFGGTRTETFGPVANVLEPGDPIIRNCEWGPTLMIVDSTKPGEDGLGTEVTMTQWSNTIVPDPDDGFLDLPPDPGTAPVPASRTLQVQGLNVVPYQRVTGGNEEPYARATWTPITDPLCDRIIIVVWPDGTIEADTRQEFDADARLQTSKLFGPLKPGTTYRRKALLVRKDGRQTYPTSEGTFTTGPFVAAITLADDSVRIQHLAQELRNERGFLVGSGPGSLAERLAEYEARQAAAELAALTDQGNSRKAFQILKAQNGASLAAVAITQQAVAELQAAFAAYQVEVATQLNEITAGGLLRIESQVDAETASAKIIFKVRAQAGDTPGEAVLQLGATSNLAGGTSDSWIGMMADRFYFLATDGEIVTQPFAIQADFVKITTLRFEHLYSLDGETIYMHGDTGDYGFGNG